MSKVKINTWFCALNCVIVAFIVNSGCRYTEIKKIKLSLSSSPQDMRQAIKIAFPQLVGNFELMRCTADRKLIELPADVDCPAKLKDYALFKRSAIYVRPLTVRFLFYDVQSIVSDFFLPTQCVSHIEAIHIFHSVIESGTCRLCLFLRLL